MTDEIKALMSAKDDLERGMHKLRIEGYDENDAVYKGLKASIAGLRSQIIAMQINQDRLAA